MSEQRGGWRHGRKRVSSIRIVKLNVAIKAETRAALGEKAAEREETLGEVIDEMVKAFEENNR